MLYSHEITKFKLKFIVDEKQKNTYTLALPDHPYSRLRMKQNGDIDFFPQVGKNSMFSVELEPPYVLLKSSVKIDDAVAYLGVKNDGQLVGSSREADSVITKFAVAMGNEAIPLSPTDSVILERWELRRFMTDGYVQLSNMVDMDAVFSCQQLFMHCLGIPGTITPGGAQVGYGKLAGSFSNCREVRALLGSPGRVVRVVEELFGQHGSLDGLNDISAQIAMRFPELSPERQIGIEDMRRSSGGTSVKCVLCDMGGSLTVSFLAHHK